MRETPTTSVTYRIPAHKLAAFEAVVGRVSRKAIKLGLSPITFTVLGEEPASVIRAFTHERDHVYQTTLYVDPATVNTVLAGWNQGGADSLTTAELVGTTTIHNVAVTGQEPYLDGWTFVATLDHAESGSVVNAVPGQTAIAVADWVSAPADCQHCGLARDRIKTYVLIDEGGNTKQLGSTCIGDFFPGLAGEQIARLAELLVTINLTAGSYDWDDGGRGSRFEGWLRGDVLTVTAAAIREYGFKSKGSTEFGGISTASQVETHLTRRPGEETRIHVEDIDHATADTVVEWVDALTPSSSDDYLWNLQSAVARPVTTSGLLGLVVSAVSAYNRAEQKRIREGAERWVPVPSDGARHTVTGKVISTRVDDNLYAYGTVLKALVLVDTPEGAYKVWGTVPDAIAVNVEVGSTVQFTARFERSDDDQFFGFYKRPTKARIL